MDELNPATLPQNNSVAPTPMAPQSNIVPPPPTTPEVMVRTMESDIRSVQATGEAVAQPITPPPPIETPPQPVQSAPMAAPVQFPVQNAPAPAPMPDVREMKSGRLLLWLFMLILVVGIGWVTYKYGLPAYRAMMPSEPIQEAAAEAAAPEPSSASLAEPVTPPAPVAPAITPLGGEQASLTKIETDGTAVSITAALAAEAAETKSASGTLTEVSLLNAGAPMSFATVMEALLPEAKTNGLDGILTAAFDPVFSAYLFYDDRGAWPGYIAKINPASQIDAATLASRLQAIETSSYKNLFLADPGAPATFRTGQARDKYIDRFVSLATDGALFSYGIFGDYVIINTSNNGLVKALDLLKL
ncbi:MAG: hypothetical protein Q7R63_00350 [bacterium]|nr:hypothetical protein [bacterium]